MSAPDRRARALCGLHVIADDAPRWGHDPVAQARAACRGGAAVVQLRAKHAGDREVLAWAREIRALTREHGALFFVNDRFDLALAADADGVHLGQEDLPPRRVAGCAPALRIGRSTHTRAELAAACDEPVDYVAFGPVFGTASKAGAHDARGLPALEGAASLAAPRPLIAIGGIGPGNAARVLAAGAAGAAVIAAVAGAADPESAARELAALLGGRA